LFSVIVTTCLQPSHREAKLDTLRDARREPFGWKTFSTGVLEAPS